MFSVGLIDVVHIPGVDLIGMINYTDTPVWIVSLLTFFAVGIPFFFLMYLGLKILVTNLKSIGNIAKFSLLGLWIISIITLAVLGIKQAAAHAYSGSVTERDTHAVTAAPDTLRIQFRDSEYGDGNGAIIGGMEIRYDASDEPVLYSDDILMDISKADDSVLSLRVRKDADGSSYKSARERAGKINYSYTLSGNTLLLDDHFTTDVKNKIRDQEIRLTVFVPEGTVLGFNSNARDYMGRRTRFDQDMYRKRTINYTWQMQADGTLGCLNCPEENPEDVESGNGRIIIDKEGVDIDLKDETDSFRMKIDEEGIRVRTNDNEP